MLYGRGGEDLVDGGPAAGRAAAEDYRANRYHGVSDEYDPAWDWAGALSDVGIYYRVGRELATSARLAELAPRRRIPRHPRPLAARGNRLSIRLGPADAQLRSA